MYLLSFQLLSMTAALQTVGSALLPWDAGFPLFPIASHADLNAYKLGKKRNKGKKMETLSTGREVGLLILLGSFFL